MDSSFRQRLEPPPPQAFVAVDQRPHWRRQSLSILLARAIPAEGEFLHHRGLEEPSWRAPGNGSEEAGGGGSGAAQRGGAEAGCKMPKSSRSGEQPRNQRGVDRSNEEQPDPATGGEEHAKPVATPWMGLKAHTRVLIFLFFSPINGGGHKTAFVIGWFSEELVRRSSKSLFAHL